MIQREITRFTCVYIVYIVPFARSRSIFSTFFIQYPFFVTVVTWCRRCRTELTIIPNYISRHRFSFMCLLRRIKSHWIHWIKTTGDENMENMWLNRVTFYDFKIALIFANSKIHLLEWSKLFDWDHIQHINYYSLLLLQNAKRSLRSLWWNFLIDWYLNILNMVNMLLLMDQMLE